MKKLFLFLMTLSTLQAMETQPEKQPTFKYFKQLPPELQKVIALNVASAPAVKQAYKNVMDLLQVDKQLSGLRTNEDFMKQLVDLLVKTIEHVKENSPERYAEYELNQWIDLARATKSNYALSRLKERFDGLPIKNKLLFLQKYFQFKVNTNQFGKARFILNNLHLFAKALENIPDAEKDTLSKENKLEKWLVHLPQEKLSPLHHATLKENLKAMQFLLEQGADINAQTEGFTPLLAAIMGGKEAATNYLIEQGANVNMATPNERMTPLMLAIIDDKPELIRKLIQHEANTGAMSADGDTALTMAQAFDRVNNTNLVSILKEEERKLFEKKVQQYKKEEQQQKLLEKSEPSAESVKPSKQEIGNDI